MRTPLTRMKLWSRSCWFVISAFTNCLRAVRGQMNSIASEVPFGPGDKLVQDGKVVELEFQIR